MEKLTQEEWDKLRTPAMNYTRCCGWIVPKTSGNPGKQQEYKDRNNYSVDVSLNHEFLD